MPEENQITGGQILFLSFVQRIMGYFSDLWIIRSTLRQSRPNKAGLKCPSVPTCVRPSVHKKFLWFQWNLACR